MNITYLIQQSLFIFRFRYSKRGMNYFNGIWLRIAGMKLGKGSSLGQCHVTWPHQVSIGKNCKLEHNIYLKYDGIWSKGPSIIIGNNVFVGFGSEFLISVKESLLVITV